MSPKSRHPSEYEQPICSQVGTDIFFSTDLDDPTQRRFGQETYKDAKKICQSCDHLMECGEWGLKHEDHGVWGGTTPAERRVLRDKHGINRVAIQLPFWVK
jgi:WhiB family redox-sensing transcriptional regulator